MSKSPYLTKSRFKLAAECPTKLFYTNKKEYADKQMEDEFLAALAEGGIQVGEYAKLVWPGGTEIYARTSDDAVRETEKLLIQEEVILYEPAFLFQDMLVRVDILIKKGNHIRLIEVKAKSFQSSSNWFNKDGTQVTSKWKPYLLDVSFQKYVVSNCLPDSLVESFLAVCDKKHLTNVAGLYGNFVIKNQDRTVVEVQDPKLVDPKIITCENADSAVEILWNNSYKIGNQSFSYESYIQKLAQSYQQDVKIDQPISPACRVCQFKTDSDNSKQKSGFHECWKSQTPLTNHDLKQPLILDLWNYRGKQKQLDKGVYKLSDMDVADLDKIEPGNPGLSQKERQALQIKYAKKKNNEPIYLDKKGLRIEMDKVQFPIHMIDFETSSTAIPFHSGMRPYEQIAFQFSHHTIEKDGSVRHENQWLNPYPEKFPNFEFVRQLKKAVGQHGSIFRYSTHENTILNAIYNQLDRSNEKDKTELQEWIQTITYRNDEKRTDIKIWEGDRNMIDLCEWVKAFYFDPATNGSNSIKAQLPSILNNSGYLQEKYSQALYGSEIPSLNLAPTIWLKKENGQLISPYKQLPKLDFLDLDADTLTERTERFMQKEELADGGAAMVAYNYMQFKGMSEQEKQSLQNALLRYCELDTLAMVMLWEGFNDLISN
ncbi:MAG: DUF2779 domain-containing protein [Chitinophagales bacterium]